MEDNKCASLDYEAEHARLCAKLDAEHARLRAKLDKAMAEANYLRDELRLKEEEMKWLCGFRSAVELIFGKGGCNA